MFCGVIFLKSEDCDGGGGIVYPGKHSDDLSNNLSLSVFLFLLKYLL